MNWIDNIFLKLSTMRSTTIDLSNSECDPMYQSNSEVQYNAQFDELEAAITTYINTPANRQQELIDMITFDFINQLRGDLSYEPDIIAVPSSASAPEGYNNYKLLFNLDGLASAILGYNNDHFFQGCIISASGTTANLQNAIATATNAEASESIKRQNLIEYYRGFSSENSFKFLVEYIQVTGNTRTKTQVGTNIYIDKGAKEIIEKLSLSIYIPTYVE